MPQVDPSNLQYYPLVALVLWALLRIWSTKAPKIWCKIPEGYRWLPPMIVGAAAGFVEAQVSGKDLKQALLHAGLGLVGIGMASSGLHGWLIESPVPYDGGKGGKPTEPVELPPEYLQAATPTEPTPPDDRPDLPVLKLSTRGALFIAALSLTVAMVPAYAGGCGLFSSSKGDQAALVAKTKVHAWNAAVVALEVLDHLEAKHLDSLKTPTPADIKKGEEALARLKRARDALAVVEGYVVGDKDGDEKKALRDALEALRLVADELKADGVQIPQRVTDGLQLASLYVGLRS